MGLLIKYVYSWVFYLNFLILLLLKVTPVTPGSDNNDWVPTSETLENEAGISHKNSS